ncbi:MAG: DUF3786 domain-containing protein [Desulfobacula sp.]|uniref:DUF3786 domain-containing protein n=1 Tax=Desulfobacula sp. TaxID=2593537 RepID=UPI0025C2199D|nr:DUF3786 domain-containing protein [Desulfobacula sp.]MCD4719050.1 DUF3786 domain-containing protein [Desulfobacula sp.]
MLEFHNSMEIFKLLPKTNCKECNAPTCLAFSVLVFKGDKQLSDCPYIGKEMIERFNGKIKKQKSVEQDFAEAVTLLKSKIAAIDLSLLAKTLGGRFSSDKLTIKILGKDFSVDSKGNFSSDIHIHQWVVMPVLNYILKDTGLPASGKWVPLRELPGGKKWYRLFSQRCEKPLKKIADTYTDLFEDMIDIFNGKQVENHYKSDISLVLHPLPKVPILICYWKPEDELDSDLNLFFDSTAEANLNIESLYTLGAGLVLMFEKIALKHGLQ